MGKVISRVSFADAQRNGLMKPVIYCGDFAKGEVKSINLELAKELETLRPNRRTMQLEACFNRVLDSLPDNVVIKDFDVMFNPAYKVRIRLPPRRFVKRPLMNMEREARSIIPPQRSSRPCVSLAEWNHLRSENRNE